MNWLLLAVVWLLASMAFTLGWAAAMRPGRRYCRNCHDPGRYHPGVLPDHVHVWTVIDGQSRIAG